MLFTACTGRGQSSFTAVHMKNSTLINNIRINCVSCTHNCRSTFAQPSVLITWKSTGPWEVLSKYLDFLNECSLIPVCACMMGPAWSAPTMTDNFLPCFSFKPLNHLSPSCYDQTAPKQSLLSQFKCFPITFIFHWISVCLLSLVLF